MAFDHAVDETMQETFRLRAVEPVDLLAMAVSNHCRKSSHLVAPGDLHILVGIHQRQQEPALIRRRQLVQ